MDEVYVRVIGINDPPVVDAGEDRSIKLKPGGMEVQLNGTIEDDGRTSVWNTLSYEWELIDGSQFGVTIDAEESKKKNPLIKITQPGEYVFKLSAFDGEYESEDTIKITAIMPENQSPEVKVGPDRMVKLKDGGETVSIPLRGRATDDNYPNESLEYEWTVNLEGNGDRTTGPIDEPDENQQCYSLASSTDLKSSISFSCDGIYRVTLTAFDGIEYSSDSLTVTVSLKDEVIDLKPKAEVELDQLEQNAVIKVSNIYDYDYLTYSLTYDCTANCNKETEEDRNSEIDKDKRVEKGITSKNKIEITDNTFERKILLGTCSKTCIYDKDVDNIKLEVTLYKENEEEPKVLNFIYEPEIELPVEISAKTGEQVNLDPTIKYLRKWQKAEGQMLLYWVVSKGDADNPVILDYQFTKDFSYTF